MDRGFDSFSAIIDAFGGPAAFGLAIGIPDSHARTMKARDSIPSERWLRTVKEANEKGLAGVTLEVMAGLAAAKAAPAGEKAEALSS